MIVISEERFYTMNPNIIMLENNGKYFYSHRNVYDQAVILNHLYSASPDKVLSTLNPDIKQNDKAYQWLKENLPKPLNILSAFVYLVDTDLGDNYEDYCGALQVITSQISTVNYVKLDKSIRSGLSWSSSIKEEYRMSWDIFFQSSSKTVFTPMKQVEQSTNSSSSENIDVPTYEELEQEAGALEEGQLYFIEESENTEEDDEFMKAFMNGTDNLNLAEDTEVKSSGSTDLSGNYSSEEKKSFADILV